MLLQAELSKMCYYLHIEVLFTNKEEWNDVICQKINGNGDHKEK